MLSQADSEAVLSFWFGELDAQGLADPEHEKRWFQVDPAFDAAIRERFSGMHDAVCAGGGSSWQGSTHGRLALVLVLDQLSRNMFRGTPRMFECDAQGLEAANEALAKGDESQLQFCQRMFLYLPFMHSEKLADQDRCVALFEAFRDEVDASLRERVGFALGFAERHRDIIRRFGRFPHRNLILERTSTESEIEFLKQPGSSF
jgi:uncharacterized protein (DUF924 family)